jgi:hypothetical protein
VKNFVRDYRLLNSPLTVQGGRYYCQNLTCAQVHAIGQDLDPHDSTASMESTECSRSRAFSQVQKQLASQIKRIGNFECNALIVLG